MLEIEKVLRDNEDLILISSIKYGSKKDIYSLSNLDKIDKEYKYIDKSNIDGSFFICNAEGKMKYSFEHPSNYVKPYDKILIPIDSINEDVLSVINDNRLVLVEMRDKFIQLVNIANDKFGSFLKLELPNSGITWNIGSFMYMKTYSMHKKSNTSVIRFNCGRAFGYGKTPYTDLYEHGFKEEKVYDLFVYKECDVNMEEMK